MQHASLAMILALLVFEIFSFLCARLLGMLWQLVSILNFYQTAQTHVNVNTVCLQLDDVQLELILNLY